MTSVAVDGDADDAEAGFPAAEERRQRLAAADQARRRGETANVVPLRAPTHAPRLDVDASDAVEGLFRAQVPAGKWLVGYIGHRLSLRFKREVWDVEFQITAAVQVEVPGFSSHELAQFVGAVVPRCVNRLAKNVRRPSLQSSFATDYRVCVERLPPRLLHLLTPRDIYYGVELEVLIGAVEVDAKKFEVPEGARYSIVRRILSRTAGRPPAWGGRSEPA